MMDVSVRWLKLLLLLRRMELLTVVIHRRASSLSRALPETMANVLQQCRGLFRTSPVFISSVARPCSGDALLRKASDELRSRARVNFFRTARLSLMTREETRVTIGR